MVLWVAGPAIALEKDTGTLSNRHRLRNRVPMDSHKRDHVKEHTHASHRKKCSPYDWSRRRCNSVTGCVWCSPSSDDAVTTASTCVSTAAANKLTTSNTDDQSYTCDTISTDSLMNDFGLRRRDSVTLIKVGKVSKKNKGAVASVSPAAVLASASPTGGVAGGDVLSAKQSSDSTMWSTLSEGLAQVNLGKEHAAASKTTNNIEQWPNLVGKSADQARAFIRKSHPHLRVVLQQEYANNNHQLEFNEHRVILVIKNGVVVSTPSVG